MRTLGKREGFVQRIFDIIAKLSHGVQRDVLTRPDAEGNTLLEYFRRLYDKFSLFPSEESFLFRVSQRISEFNPTFLRGGINCNEDFSLDAQDKDETRLVNSRQT
jgi:hypothetical protein